jgi:hypothetical protein
VNINQDTTQTAPLFEQVALEAWFADARALKAAHEHPFDGWEDPRLAYLGDLKAYGSAITLDQLQRIYFMSFQPDYPAPPLHTPGWVETTEVHIDEDGEAAVFWFGRDWSEGTPIVRMMQCTFLAFNDEGWVSASPESLRIETRIEEELSIDQAIALRDALAGVTAQFIEVISTQARLDAQA